MKTKRVICLYGGPGAGKSTTCAGLYYKLKLAGYNTEMLREYVKEWVWENRSIKDGDQTYFFAKQSRKERIYIANGLDFIITDSPLVLTHFYGLKFDSMEKSHNTSLVMLKHHHEFCKKNGYKADHFILSRKKDYNPAGRYQTEAEAKGIDAELPSFLESLGIDYHNVPGDVDSVDYILKALEKIY